MDWPFQVHDCQPDSENRFDSICCDIGMALHHAAWTLLMASIVMALDNSPAGIFFYWIWLWCCGSFLVRCRLQSHDCLLCLAGYFLQEKDSRSTHFFGTGSNSIWWVYPLRFSMTFSNLPRTNCPCRLHDPVFGQQHLCQCQHAARSCSSYCSSVSIFLFINTLSC